MSRILVGACLALGLMASGSRLSGAEMPGPFSDVPSGNPAYRWITTLEREGLFTGYPDGSFDGRQLRSRYEFAVVVQRLVREFPLRIGGSGLDPSGYTRMVWGARVAALRKLPASPLRDGAEKMIRHLARQFQPDLAMLGVDVDQQRRNLERMSAVSPAAVIKEPNVAFQQGLDESRQEWDQGTVFLYGGQHWGYTGRFYDRAFGLPQRALYSCLLDQQILDYGAGHNWEVYQLIIQRGLPSGSRLRWLAELEEPDRLWRGHPRETRRIDPTLGTSPKVGFEVIEKNGVERIRVVGSQLSQPIDTFARRPGVTVSLVAGPKESDLVFARYRAHEAAVDGWMYVIFDQRDGNVLATRFQVDDRSP